MQSFFGKSTALFWSSHREMLCGDPTANPTLASNVTAAPEQQRMCRVSNRAGDIQEQKARAAAIVDLSEAIEALAGQLRSMIRDGTAVHRIQERAKLVDELMRELQGHLDAVMNTQCADNVAAMLMQRVRQL
jgi:hypothetical protein